MHATGLHAAVTVLTCFACLLLAARDSVIREPADRFRSVLPAITSWADPRSTKRSWDRSGRDYLAFCLILKDQHKDIREWVGHHHAIGASTLYVHDHRSEPPLRELLTDYIDAGIVQYVWWERGWDNWNYTLHNNPQIDVYNTCLRKYGHRHQFIGFLDSDEFLIVKDKSLPSVPHLLRELMAQKPIGGLAVHWRVFGSSGHDDPPTEGVLKAFTKCTPVNNSMNDLVKTLANTDYAVKNAGHLVELNSTDVHIVKEDGSVVTSPKAPPSLQNRLSLHHYMVKSRQEFLQKRARGGGSGRKRGEAWFGTINDAATEDCMDASNLGPYV